jgi:hypothetical protein
MAPWNRSAVAELATTAVEIAAILQVGDQSALGRSLAQQFAGECAGCWGVQAEEHGQEAEMAGGIVGRLQRGGRI